MFLFKVTLNIEVLFLEAENFKKAEEIINEYVCGSLIKKIEIIGRKKDNIYISANA